MNQHTPSIYAKGHLLSAHTHTHTHTHTGQIEYATWTTKVRQWSPYTSRGIDQSETAHSDMTNFRMLRLFCMHNQ